MADWQTITLSTGCWVEEKNPTHPELEKIKDPMKSGQQWPNSYPDDDTGETRRSTKRSWGLECQLSPSHAQKTNANCPVFDLFL